MGKKILHVWTKVQPGVLNELNLKVDLSSPVPSFLVGRTTIRSWPLGKAGHNCTKWCPREIIQSDYHIKICVDVPKDLPYEPAPVECVHTQPNTKGSFLSLLGYIEIEIALGVEGDSSKDWQATFEASVLSRV